MLLSSPDLNKSDQDPSRDRFSPLQISDSFFSSDQRSDQRFNQKQVNQQSRSRSRKQIASSSDRQSIASATTVVPSRNQESLRKNQNSPSEEAITHKETRRKNRRHSATAMTFPILALLRKIELSIAVLIFDIASASRDVC
jgi:hypothetical protein